MRVYTQSPQSGSAVFIHMMRVPSPLSPPSLVYFRSASRRHRVVDIPACTLSSKLGGSRSRFQVGILREPQFWTAQSTESTPAPLAVSRTNGTPLHQHRTAVRCIRCVCGAVPGRSCNVLGANASGHGQTTRLQNTGACQAPAKDPPDDKWFTRDIGASKRMG